MNVDYPGRPRAHAAAPKGQWRPGNTHMGSAHTDKHLGELAEAEASQRGSAGQSAISLLLEAA